MADSKNNELKMCQACRALIPASATRCEMCGADGHYAERGGNDEAAWGGLGAWPVTTLVLSLNVLLYAIELLYQMRVGGATGLAVSPSGPISNWFGASNRDIFQTGEWWRLLASCFLHGGPLHILFNSMALLQAGRLAETIFGRSQYICLYVLAGIGGNWLAIWLDKTPRGVQVVGASGAIFGLIAALAVYGYRRGDLLGQSLRQDMVYWLLYGLVMSFLPGLNISWQAHLGGAIVGAGLALLMPDMETLRQRLAGVRIVQALAVLVWLTIAGTGALMARNLVRQNGADRVIAADQFVSNVWRNQERLALLLEAVEQKQRPNPPEAVADVTPAQLAAGVDRTYKALCSDTGALERLPEIDAQSAQLFRQMAANLRARCDHPLPPPRAEDFKSFAPYLAQAEKAKEFEDLYEAYRAWLMQVAKQYGL